MDKYNMTTYAFQACMAAPTVNNWLHFWSIRFADDVTKFLNMVPDGAMTFSRTAFGYEGEKAGEVVARHECRESREDQNDNLVATTFYVRGLPKAFRVSVEVFDDDPETRTAFEKQDEELQASPMLGLLELLNGKQN